METASHITCKDCLQVNMMGKKIYARRVGQGSLIKERSTKVVEMHQCSKKLV
jgi:hypothetical protein